MDNDTTTVRIARSDVTRIRTHINRLSMLGKGRYSANDIVKNALDAYEEKINQTNDKSSNYVEKVQPNSGV